MRKIKLLLFILLISCQGKNQKTMSEPHSETKEYAHTNNLVNETSPYLLQHAHNPVDWNPWNDDVLAKAQKENKLIIISVGYAACHWCHVMEHESFEDEEVAKVMNEKFINIKVDREERPDVDQVYMNAVQLMTGSGGWPLNVITLPDGRPIWGGTYFKKEQWMKSLEQIYQVYIDEPDKLREYADKLEQGIRSLDIIEKNSDEAVFETAFVENAIKKWSSRFDRSRGGMNTAPKFMMPNNYHFLLRFAHQNKDEKLMDYVNTTLRNMAFGGIYDHLGGGFSRYSVDAKWHVPHFEKMLYDNAQLVSLYADAYLVTKNELYKNVIIETLQFVEEELMGDEGNFYSSLDADSKTEEGELEEGAFYVWKKDELNQLLGKDYELFFDYYNINGYGLWEKQTYVLIRKDEDSAILKKHNLTQEQLNAKKAEWKRILLQKRNQRNKPRLDDKTLTSWNALMLKGYVDAYRVLGDEKYLDTAVGNAQFILDNQLRSDGGLNHNYKDGKSTINGYLEDYSNVIEAFIELYQQTLDRKWINTAKNLTDYAIEHFFDDDSHMFFFTSNTDSNLVSRTIEFRDNVIPASNSIMAKNLFKLSHYFDKEAYMKMSTTMLNNVKPEISEYASGYSNWMDLMLNFSNPYYEVAIVGSEVKDKIQKLNTYYLPNKMLVASAKEEYLPLLENRYVEDETLIYVCVNKACKLPVKEIRQAMELMVLK